VCRQQRFVVVRAGRGVSARLVVDHDRRPRADARGDFLPLRPQALVDEDDPVLRVLDDVRQVRLEQADVERVEHRPHARDGHVRLEVLLMVPAERRDPVPRLDAERPERSDEPARAGDHLPERGGDQAVLRARRDRLLRVHAFGMTNNRLDPSGCSCMSPNMRRIVS
jgi:hypothetical protein